MPYAPSNKPTAIYFLTDQDGAVRYIGKAVDPRKRYREHLQDKRHQYYSARWIRSEIAEGRKPQMQIVEWCGSNWEERERYWIQHGKAQGWRLTNLTDGGEGAAGWIQTPEWLEKMRQAGYRRRHTEEEKRKISESNKGKVISPEARAKASAKMRGRKLTVEQRKKIGEGGRRVPRTPEWNRRLSERLRGRKRPVKIKVLFSKVLEACPDDAYICINERYKVRRRLWKAGIFSPRP